MTDVVTLLNKLTADREAYYEFKKNQEAAMLEAAKSLYSSVFEAFPFVEAFSWAQWTPYFNDGDACEFGVHEICAMKEGYIEADDFGYPEDNEYVIPMISNSYLKQRNEGAELSKWAKEALNDWDLQGEEYGAENLDNLHAVIQELTQIPDEIYESFGEGIVVVSREGIEVYEYSHD